MAPPPRCSQTPAAVEPSEAELYRDFASFDWSILNTPASRIRKSNRKPENDIEQESEEHLHEIEESFGNPPGLTSLVEGTRALMDVDWKEFHLHFDYRKDFPGSERWSSVEWRKFDLVEFFTKICYQYHAEVVQAEESGVMLGTEKFDEEFLALLQDLLDVEDDGSGIVLIKDWERAGTRTTLATESLMVEEMKVSEENDDREMLYAEGEEDIENETEDETFDGQSMSEALGEVRIAAKRPQRKPWCVMLPTRSSADGAGSREIA